MRFVVHSVTFDYRSDDRFLNACIYRVAGMYEEVEVRASMLQRLIAEINGMLRSEIGLVCMLIHDAFLAVGAKPHEYRMNETSMPMIYYALGFTSHYSLENSDGIDGKPLPPMEFIVTEDLFLRLFEYFRVCREDVKTAAGEKEINEMFGKAHMSYCVWFRTPESDDELVLNCDVHF